MKHLIGGATSFSSGGPGKGMYCRAVTNLMQKYYFISSADVICSNFTDSGLFGITVSGIGSHQMDLLSVAMEELHKLREPIPPAELNRTKNIAKMNILISLERQGDRCEELGRAFQTFGDVEIHNYVKKIGNVTGEQIN